MSNCIVFLKYLHINNIVLLSEKTILGLNYNIFVLKATKRNRFIQNHK